MSQKTNVMHKTTTIKKARIYSNLKSKTNKGFVTIDLSKPFKSERAYVGDENMEDFRRLFGK